MNIYEIKRRTEKTAPYFFTTKTLKFFGQTMKSFKVYKQHDGNFLIVAPSYYRGQLMGYTKRIFNPVTNELERIKEE